MGIILVALYIFAFLFAIKVKFSSSYNQKLFYLYLSACYVVAALRDSSFPDYEEYANIYKSISSLSFWEAITSQDIHGEIGFKTINWLLSCISDDVTILMIIFSGLSLFLFYKICYQYSINPVYAWLVYFPYSFMLKDLAQIRNAVASLLVVYALLSLTKIRSFLILIIASVFFQKYTITSIIATYKPKIIYKNYFWIFIVLMFFIPSVNIEQLQGVPVIGFDLSRYINSEYVVGNSIFQKFKMLVLALFVSVCFIRVINNDRRLKSLYVAFIGAYFYYCLFFNIPIISQRLGGYLSSVEPFLFALLLEKVSKRNSILFFIFILLLSFFYFMFNIFSRDFLKGLFVYGTQ
ncbi:EpsG family protein [Enterobacter asburiae]|nr:MULTISPECIES: EpsG family protein [Enterobacter]MDU4483581.1 EpsG family protein [Enterobacter sp.]BBW46694.1 hypothetical protein STN0717ENT73_30080 [Enterobacter cloacae]EKS6753552.1 EpsG family protein [Enterobacter asburiae]ELF1047524.1 EpsG family protein [Enterobacter asburiae]EUL40930.1 hypothetical protein P852_02762 [Enterobacter asburiae]